LKTQVASEQFKLRVRKSMPRHMSWKVRGAGKNK
jgi:hypothetical protein